MIRWALLSAYSQHRCVWLLAESEVERHRRVGMMADVWWVLNGAERAEVKRLIEEGARN